MAFYSNLLTLDNSGGGNGFICNGNVVMKNNSLIQYFNCIGNFDLYDNASLVSVQVNGTLTFHSQQSINNVSQLEYVNQLASDIPSGGKNDTVSRLLNLPWFIKF